MHTSPPESTPVEKEMAHETKGISTGDVASPDFAQEEGEIEPQLTVRTYIALLAFALLNFSSLMALQGPQSVLNYIGTDLGNTTEQVWIPVILNLVQGAVGPVLSTASDTFQARKAIICACTTIAFVGSCIAPGSESLPRLIVANALIGAGYTTLPLAYAVPSEILPRRWRPLVQGTINMITLSACVVGPMAIGTLTEHNPHTGWRYYFWLEAGLWGATTIALLIGYNPPKRVSPFEDLSFWQKIGKLDLTGCALLVAGLALFVTGATLGGVYTWTDARVLSTLVIGIVIMVVFCLYEWKGTSTGILHHDLFRGGRDHGRTFAICTGLLFLEASMIFGYALFYPILTQVLFTSDPILIVGRSQAAWVPAIFASLFWAYLCTRTRSIKWPLVASFAIYTIGLIGLATLQPGQNISSIAFAVILGIGYGGPNVLTVSGVQLSTPNGLIATATSCETSSRAVAASIVSAINVAAFTSRFTRYLPEYISKAAIGAGLPAASLPAFIGALSTNDAASLASIPGVNPMVIADGASALKQAYADAIRVVYMIAAPLGAVACIASFFVGEVKETMNNTIDAPIDEVNPKLQEKV